MNAKGFAGDRAFFLPDPWCVAEPCWPPEIEIYAKVVTTSVQEYSNARMPLNWCDYATFLSFLAGHGLSLTTVSAILAQLISEKLVASIFTGCTT